MAFFRAPLALVPGLLLALACGTPSRLPACPELYAGCQSFTDGRDPGANRTVRFGGAVGNAYAPECLEVRRGQTVTFAGDFPAHPLEAVCGVREGLEGETVVNGQVAVTLGEVGLVGYRCREHGTVEGGGMVGLVKVSE